MKKRIVAIDFGMKRCGLAISNDTQTMALPWTTVTGGFQSVISTLQKRRTEIEGVIIGLPLLMNGTKGEMAATVEKFAKALENALQISVILVDERLSSKHAESALRETGQNRKRRSEKTDETAATFLLQSYLESIFSKTALTTKPETLPAKEAIIPETNPMTVPVIT